MACCLVIEVRCWASASHATKVERRVGSIYARACEHMLTPLAGGRTFAGTGVQEDCAMASGFSLCCCFVLFVVCVCVCLFVLFLFLTDMHKFAV